MIHEQGFLVRWLADPPWCVEHGICCCKTGGLCPFSVCRSHRLRVSVRPCARLALQASLFCVSLLCDRSSILRVHVARFPIRRVTSRPGHATSPRASTRVVADRTCVLAAAIGRVRPRHRATDLPTCLASDARASAWRGAHGKRRDLAVHQTLRDAARRTRRASLRDPGRSEAKRRETRARGRGRRRRVAAGRRRKGRACGHVLSRAALPRARVRPGAAASLGREGCARRTLLERRTRRHAHACRRLVRRRSGRLCGSGRFHGRRARPSPSTRIHWMVPRRPAIRSKATPTSHGRLPCLEEALPHVHVCRRAPAPATSRPSRTKRRVG
mmetsp:Transcript_78/g.221  ORF Transcript_78/g.221 Transcript_78/m.221 type:complete len:328 (-) Transcript_78:1786-2769(-)